MSIEIPRSSRSDANKNRAHVLATAEKCFAERGIGVPMDAIAKKAGVGAGTLYRHFPNKEALIAALVADQVGDLEREHRDLLGSGDDDDAKLDKWLQAMRAWMNRYQGLAEPLRQAWEKQFTPLGVNCMGVIRMTEELLLNAQERGRARADVSGRDLYLANLGVAWASSGSLTDEATQASMASLINAGWRAPAGTARQPGDTRGR